MTENGIIWVSEKGLISLKSRSFLYHIEDYKRMTFKRFN